MPTESQCCSMAARYDKTHLRSSKNLPRMHLHQFNLLFPLHYRWQKVASDLFHFKGKTYLLCVDYFSIMLNNTTSKGVITALKNIFACHGLPETLLSDNGPHYSLHDMKEFASMYEFVHTTSSPHNPRSNGPAERTVKTIKSLMNKSSDVNFLLLNYHSNLHRCNLSPSELLMGRRIRTVLPQVPE